MWKWVLGVAVLAGVAYVGYHQYRGGFFSAPELQEGEFLLSFKNGFRGVMHGIEDERTDRKYFGHEANNVPNWYQDTWSKCRMPSKEEVASIEAAVDLGPGGRLDAICEINADGDVFVRGWIYSVPDL